MRLIDADILLDEICRDQCERKYKDCDSACEIAAYVVNAPTIGGLISVVEDMLLIGKEPVKVKNGFSYVFCGACNLALAPLGRQKSWKYCPWCGKKVDWNAAD